MRSVVSGNAPLLAELKKRVPERRWATPAGESYAQLAPFLVAHPVPAEAKGVVFTSTSGDWLKVANAGWTVYWCDPNVPAPYGTQPVEREHADWSMVDLCAEYFHVHVTDKRLVGDIVQGRTNKMGVMLCVTSNTGGVGKTTSSRQLAQRASEMGVSTLLVDGNIRQPSQRSFFDPQHTMSLRTIADWHEGMRMNPRMGATHGAKALHVGYDVAFAPPPGASVTIDHYNRYIAQARRLWQLIVLDLDRVSAADLTDRATMAGGLLVPAVRNGDLALVIVKAGGQTQADATTLLDAFSHLQLPRERIGVKLTIPTDLDGVDHDTFLAFDYSRFTFLGLEQQTVAAGRHIARLDRHWDDPQLSEARERTLAWALPDAGFTPDRYRAQSKKHKGWFK